jgi:hypothetical protein
MFSAKMSALVLMALTASVSAHCGTQPALGVPGGTITKADVQRVVAGANCGKTDVASTIDSSVAVPAAADGTFTVTANSFDPGSDGSSLMTATLDTTGTGKAFPATVDITKNGNAVQPTSARMSEATGGVSRLVSWPRKKPTKTLVANNTVGLRLAA